MGLQYERIAEQLGRVQGRSDRAGTRKAIIGFLLAVYSSGRQAPISEVLVALELIDAQLSGRPHTLQSLAHKLTIPYTSVSRIVFALSKEASPDGILRLVQDTLDRRCKRIEVDFEALQTGSPYGRLLDELTPEHRF